MRLFPVALDFRPPYLADSAGHISLLLMPLGQGTLLDPAIPISVIFITGNMVGLD